MVLRLGSHGPLVMTFQKGLNALNFPVGEPDGNFGPATEAAVQDFQEAHGLNNDGVAGQATIAAYNASLNQICVAEDYSIPFEATPAAPVASSLLTWTKLPADALRGGYAFTHLRSDVAPSYTALYETVHSLSGVLTSAGGRRPLTTEASAASQSKTSMHYVGRAFDMAIPTGMVDPETDPFIIVEDGDKWIVWCRSTLDPVELASKCSVLGIGGGAIKVEGVYVGGGATHSKSVLVTAFNFTDLALTHGFHRISARKAFRAKADVMAAEWWHFQREEGLVPNQTTFGEELLKVYSPAECQQFVYWNEVKDYKFKENWF